MAAAKKRVTTKLSAASNKTAQMKKSAANRQSAAAESSAKKLGLERSASREAFLRATEELLREQGFAAITSRIIAERAGLKAQLIHYYFNTMEDLYVAVFRRGAELDLERLRAAKRAKRPLKAMWQLSTDPKSARFATEFITIANHIEAVRAEISIYAKKRRELQVEIMTEQLAAAGIEPEIPPVVTVMIMENVARGFLLESALGLKMGHREAQRFVDSCLAEFESRSAADAPKPALKPAKRSSKRTA